MDSCPHRRYAGYCGPLSTFYRVIFSLAFLDFASIKFSTCSFITTSETILLSTLDQSASSNSNSILTQSTDVPKTLISPTKTSVYLTTFTSSFHSSYVPDLSTVSYTGSSFIPHLTTQSTTIEFDKIAFLATVLDYVVDVESTISHEMTLTSSQMLETTVPVSHQTTSIDYSYTEWGTLQVTPSVAPTTVVCDCYCPTSPVFRNNTVMKWIKDVKRNLTLDSLLLSKHKRKLTSAPDSRQSSHVMGVIGITVLSFVGAFLMFLDIAGNFRSCKAIKYYKMK